MAAEDLRTTRECPRCLYPVRPGYVHEEVPQPQPTNVTVCRLKAVPGAILRGPMVDVISAYLDKFSIEQPHDPMDGA